MRWVELWLFKYYKLNISKNGIDWNFFHYSKFVSEKRISLFDNKGTRLTVHKTTRREFHCEIKRYNPYNPLSHSLHAVIVKYDLSARNWNQLIVKWYFTFLGYTYPNPLSSNIAVSIFTNNWWRCVFRLSHHLQLNLITMNSALCNV